LQSIVVRKLVSTIGIFEYAIRRTLAHGDFDQEAVRGQLKYVRAMRVFGGMAGFHLDGDTTSTPLNEIVRPSGQT
jgi:hypothetical protein